MVSAATFFFCQIKLCIKQFKSVGNYLNLILTIIWTKKYTSAVSTYTIFGLCMHTWENFAFEQSHWLEFWVHNMIFVRTKCPCCNMLRGIGALFGVCWWSFWLEKHLKMWSQVKSVSHTCRWHANFSSLWKLICTCNLHRIYLQWGFKLQAHLRRNLFYANVLIVTRVRPEDSKR